jgi:hypothetical protein
MMAAADERKAWPADPGYAGARCKARATLQDDWRADLATGRLRDLVEGHPTCHIVHLPLNYDDGAGTGKADWPVS